MQVFKLFFRIIQKNLPAISIYLAVMLGMSFVFSSTGSVSQETHFAQSKVKLSIVNADKGGALSAGLAAYLWENTTPVALENDTDALRDALFFRETAYVLIIPTGFSASLVSGDTPLALQKMNVPDSAAAVQVESLIARYLNLAEIYLKSDPGIAQDALVENIAQDMHKTAHTALTGVDTGENRQPVNYYFSYFPYAVMAIMMMAITSVMLSTRQRDIRRRNEASPLPITRFNLQLVLGSVVFSLAVWAVLTLAGGIIYADQLDWRTLPLLAANALIYTLVSLSMSFLFGFMIKNRNMQSAVTNVVTLGLCFISGVFVPQEYLGDVVQKIARLFPTYWYVKAVNLLDAGAYDGGSVVSQVVGAQLIQIGFFVAFLSLGLAVSRLKTAGDD